MNVNFLIHSPTQPAESQDELEPKAEETAEPNQFRLSEKDIVTPPKNETVHK